MQVHFDKLRAELMHQWIADHRGDPTKYQSIGTPAFDEWAKSQGLDPKVYADSLKTGLPFYQELDIPQQDVMVRVGVYDVGSGTMGAMEFPLSVKQVAAILGVSVQTVHRWFRKRAVIIQGRHNSMMLIPQRTLDDWIREHTARR